MNMFLSVTFFLHYSCSSYIYHVISLHYDVLSFKSISLVAINIYCSLCLRAPHYINFEAYVGYGVFSSVSQRHQSTIDSDHIVNCRSYCDNFAL